MRKNSRNFKKSLVMLCIMSVFVGCNIKETQALNLKYKYTDVKTGNIYDGKSNYDYIFFIKGNDQYSELWRYNQEIGQELIYKEEYFSYELGKENGMIAINIHEQIGYDDPYENKKILQFIDKDKKILKTFTKDDLGANGNIDFNIELEGFSDDNSVFWCSLMDGPWVNKLLKINTKDWSLTYFDKEVKGLLHGDYQVNPNTGLICYSDYIFQFDVDDAIEYENSDEDVNIYVYDTNTNKIHFIDKCKPMHTYLKWISNDAFECIKRNTAGAEYKKTYLVNNIK